MDINSLIKECKEKLRIIDNYLIENPPKDTTKDKEIIKTQIRLDIVITFFKKVEEFEFEQIEILDSENSPKSALYNLHASIFNEVSNFIASKNTDLDKARKILVLILDLESYFKKIKNKPWDLGKKISLFEQIKLRRIFRKKLHEAEPINGKVIRGTRVRVLISGSLARGYSDWKSIGNENVLKPTDYGLPREYRKDTKMIYSKIDTELNVHEKLKYLMSDVDILIISEVIFDSIDLSKSTDGWSFRLGEKYDIGLGGSKILGRLLQVLKTVKIGDIKGRCINFYVLRDEEGYNKYLLERQTQINKKGMQIGKKINITDITIIDEIIK
ncbi:MAG: hypothetical protein WC413_02935 [Candidatus Nanoarchaeia archaeon]